MPSIKDKATVEAIARVYCSEGKRNKTETLKIVGYSKGYYLGGRSAKVLWGNERVIEAIKAIDAEISEKLEHNRDIALSILREALKIARKEKNSRDIVAVCREMNDITGLHKQIIETTDLSKPVLDDVEREAVRDLARQYKLKLARSAG